MVEIDLHRVVVGLDDAHGNGHAGRGVGPLEHVAFLQLVAEGKHDARVDLHALILVAPVGLLGGDDDGLLLARLHVAQRIFDAGADLASAEHDLERLAGGVIVNRLLAVDAALVVDIETGAELAVVLHGLSLSPNMKCDRKQARARHAMSENPRRCAPKPPAMHVQGISLPPPREAGGRRA